MLAIYLVAMVKLRVRACGLRVFCFDSFYNKRDAQPVHAALIDTMRAPLAFLLLLVAASLAAADYPVPIYSHTGTVIQPPHIPRCMLCICPHTPRVMQPYDNGFYVATQARARIQKFLEVIGSCRSLNP